MSMRRRVFPNDPFRSSGIHASPVALKQTFVQVSPAGPRRVAAPARRSGWPRPEAEAWTKYPESAELVDHRGRGNRAITWERRVAEVLRCSLSSYVGTLCGWHPAVWRRD